ncbi:ATP-binding cassette domain-containing protein [Streptomyces violaceoruber]|uniref:ABC transporter ATP-binding protein n=1 Tax=Streptomyces violaceoruber TaxID=1935 RepID=UPI001F48B080|nr:ATP-binding cassette domain-containing protein [Streptomyces violaceoruber]MCF3165777.1 ATP-binding cassette domain-containing protein [Streptomyces violaceoruber]
MRSRHPESAIFAEDLSKSFRVAVTDGRRWQRLRSFIAPRYELREAVRDISLTVDYGEFVALLGPNGAGKSTTIKLLTGILTPSSGELLVGGRRPTEDRRRNAELIGVVFGQRTQLWWDLPALDSLKLLRDVFGVSDADFRKRLAEFDKVLELSGFWETPVRHLSLGQRVRCDLAAAIIHDPRVVFLDEPTIGMDVVVKEQVREFLRYQVEQRGRTVVLTTHDMVEVEKLTSRVVLVNQGTIVFDDTIDELKSRHAPPRRITVSFDGAASRPEVRGADVIAWDGHEATFKLDPESTPHGVIRELTERYEVTDIAIREGDLEELMRSAYRIHSPQTGATVVQ